MKHRTTAPGHGAGAGRREEPRALPRVAGALGAPVGSPAPGPKPTIHGRLVDELGRAIVEGRLPAGEILRMEALERTHRVSRTLVREAVRVLEAMQLVTSRRRVGVTVQGQERWKVFDPQVIAWRLEGEGRLAQLQSLTELRRAVEPVAARAAARRAEPPERARLLELSEAMRQSGEAGDLGAFLAHDVAFHQLVLVASHNEMFAALAGAVEAVLVGRTTYNLFPRRPRAEALRWHAEIARAIHDGRGGRAEAAMHALIGEVGGQFRRMLAREP